MILDLFRKEIGYNNIQGYDDMVRRALDAEDNYNLLFTGPPASAKTLFLLGVLEHKKGVYFDGSNTTNRILDVLEEKRSKIICIDDRCPDIQEKLLNFIESGHIKLDQMRIQYDFKINGLHAMKLHAIGLRRRLLQIHCLASLDYIMQQKEDYLVFGLCVGTSFRSNILSAVSHL